MKVTDVLGALFHGLGAYGQARERREYLARQKQLQDEELALAKEDRDYRRKRDEQGDRAHRAAPYREHAFRFQRPDVLLGAADAIESGAELGDRDIPGFQQTITSKPPLPPIPPPGAAAGLGAKLDDRFKSPYGGGSALKGGLQAKAGLDPTVSAQINVPGTLGRAGIFQRAGKPLWQIELEQKEAADTLGHRRDLEKLQLQYDLMGKNDRERQAAIDARSRLNHRVKLVTVSLANDARRANSIDGLRAKAALAAYNGGESWEDSWAAANKLHPGHPPTDPNKLFAELGLSEVEAPLLPPLPGMPGGMPGGPDAEEGPVFSPRPIQLGPPVRTEPLPPDFAPVETDTTSPPEFAPLPAPPGRAPRPAAGGLPGLLPGFGPVGGILNNLVQQRPPLPPRPPGPRPFPPRERAAGALASQVETGNPVDPRWPYGPPPGLLDGMPGFEVATPGIAGPVDVPGAPGGLGVSPKAQAGIDNQRSMIDRRSFQSENDAERTRITRRKTEAATKLAEKAYDLRKQQFEHRKLVDGARIEIAKGRYALDLERFDWTQTQDLIDNTLANAKLELARQAERRLARQGTTSKESGDEKLLRTRIGKLETLKNQLRNKLSGSTESDAVKAGIFQDIQQVDREINHVTAQLNQLSTRFEEGGAGGATRAGKALPSGKGANRQRYIDAQIPILMQGGLNRAQAEAEANRMADARKYQR